MNTELKVIIKSICYRFLAILASIPFVGIVNSLKLHIVLTLVYYIHEKIWVFFEKRK
jgi:uncharacterized membrane protein